MPPRPITPEQQYRFQLILWFAMVFSIVMYLVVIRLVPPQAAADNPTLVSALLVVAFSVVAASFLVKFRFFARAAETGNAQFRRAGFLIALVLCEVAALLGVIVWFLTGSSRTSWFLLLGFAGDLLHFPARGE